MLTYFYNDLLFEVYHFISQSNILILNKSSKRLQIIDKRIDKYINQNNDDNMNNDNMNNNIDKILYVSCRDNNIYILLRLIKRYASNLNYDYGLDGACFGGNLKLAKLMIKLGANNWDCCFTSACVNGNIKLVMLMIKNGANNFNHGLKIACGYNNIELVKIMIKYGANNWDSGLSGACRYNNEDLQSLMIEKGATWCSYCENSAFCH